MADTSISISHKNLTPKTENTSELTHNTHTHTYTKGDFLLTYTHTDTRTQTICARPERMGACIYGLRSHTHSTHTHTHTHTHRHTKKRTPRSQTDSKNELAPPRTHAKKLAHTTHMALTMEECARLSRPAQTVRGDGDGRRVVPRMAQLSVAV